MNYVLYKKNGETLLVHSTEEYERLLDNKKYFKAPHEAKAVNKKAEGKDDKNPETVVENEANGTAQDK